MMVGHYSHVLTILSFEKDHPSPHSLLLLSLTASYHVHPVVLKQDGCDGGNTDPDEVSATVLYTYANGDTITVQVRACGEG
jgi:hypothetical protein